MGQEPATPAPSGDHTGDPVRILVDRLAELQEAANAAGLGTVAERASHVRLLLTALYPPPGS